MSAAPAVDPALATDAVDAEAAEPQKAD